MHLRGHACNSRADLLHPPLLQLSPRPPLWFALPRFPDACVFVIRRRTFGALKISFLRVPIISSPGINLFLRPPPSPPNLVPFDPVVRFAIKTPVSDGRMKRN